MLEFPIPWTKNKKTNPYGPRPDKAQQNTPFKMGRDVHPFKSSHVNQEDKLHLKNSLVLRRKPM